METAVHVHVHVNVHVYVDVHVNVDVNVDVDVIGFFLWLRLCCAMFIPHILLS